MHPAPTTRRTTSPTQHAALWGVLVCIVWGAGCSSLHVPQIDPTGQRIFLHRSAPHQEPGVLKCKYDSAVRIAPQTIVAPVGSEVILTAGVCGYDGFLMAGERVEWMLAQGGVGELIALGERESMVDTARKVDNHYAIGTTSRRYLSLNRGTPTPQDDVYVLRGQAWISVTSPREGTSHVTAFAPDVYGWDRRKDTARIEWVDARWQLPPPAVNPAGTAHVFTTLVARRSDNTPLAGWTVRYTITGGPAGGFKPDGAQTVEATSNGLGQASAEMFQTAPAQGVNTIRVEVIRPGLPALGVQPLVIGSGDTQKTWSAPQIGLDKSGPAEAAPGATLTYRIQVSNGSGVPAKNVVVTDRVPAGASYLGSTPPAEVGRDGNLTWNLGDLAGGQARSIELNLKAEQAGSINNCATVQTAEGLTAQDCASTTIRVQAARLDLKIEGPTQAAVGSNADYTVRVTNLGDAPATGLIVRDTFDAGLEIEGADGAVERNLEDLAPGASKAVRLRFRVAKPGRQCHTVEVLSQGSSLAKQQACLEAIAAAIPPVTPPVEPPPRTQPPITPPDQPEDPAAGPPATLSIRKLAVGTASVGEVVKFRIQVRNEGTTVAKSFKIIDLYDAALQPIKASGGNQVEGNALTWTFTNLAPGAMEPVEIECKCVRPGARVCSPASVETPGAQPQRTEHCLEIRDAAKLSVGVVSLNNPVIVGQSASFVIRVRNEGQSVARQIVVQATLPPEMTLVTVEQTNPMPYRRAAGLITFDAYPELGPGEKLEYGFALRADRAGAAALTATAAAAGVSPVSKGVETTISPPR